MDIRLKAEPFELNGKVYDLCCNMNVLADVQEAFDGDFMSALRNPAALKTALAFLAAMLNDCADTNGWPERFTAKELGRIIPATPTEILKLTDVVALLVSSSIMADKTADQEEAAEEKN